MDIGGNVAPTYEDASFPMCIQRHISAGASGQPGCWHEDLEFKLVAAGTTIAVIDSEILAAHTDEILFMNPYQIHSLPVVEGNDRRYYLFMMHLDFFQKTGIHSLDLRKIFMKDHLRIRSHIRNPRLTEILKKILAADDAASPYKQQYIQGLLMEFFSILLQEETTDTSSEEITEERMRYYYVIEPAVIAIQSQYNQKISSENLAQLCQLSLFYFCRVFKRVMGMTPTQYQNEYRMQIADMLLKDNKHSVSSIAHMVGFDDEAYFSRCYKKYKGVSPRQIKNKNL